MPNTETIVPHEITLLVEQKKFPEVEDQWIRLMETEPVELPVFFAIAASAKKKGNPVGAVGWLRLLADDRIRRGDAEGRLRVLEEIARMAPTDEAIRGELDAALKQRFAGHPALAAVLAKNPIVGATDPAGAAGRVERWLRFRPGDIYHLPGRGPGRIVEMN
ncbi:MAG: hypothetical protein ABI592_04115, partial [Acidobacteriota bacterium]